MAQEHEDFMGRTGEDTISGFRGVVTAYVYYMTGCNQVLLSPRVKDDGSHQDSYWFDAQRVKLEAQAPIVLNNTKTPGFGPEAPKR